MATIQLDPGIPPNIHEIELSRPRLVRKLFERGEVVLLRGVKIDADFDFLSTVEPPHGDGSRRGKYVFWRVIEGARDERTSVWQMFREEVFRGDDARFRYFHDQVRSVDRQLNAVVAAIFNRHTFITETITWKFQRNRGENLHIDNLNGSDRVAQVRLFANLDNKPRRWSIGRHWRHYADRLYHDAGLSAVADDPCVFNNRLTAAAFGVSTAQCDEPRHLVEFDPGEVWLANSPLVAHQVRGGDVLALAHHEYSYARYIDRAQSLPAQLRDLVRRQSDGAPSMTERLQGAFRRVHSGSAA